jgi:hypothetical protein
MISKVSRHEIEGAEVYLRDERDLWQDKLLVDGRAVVVLLKGRLLKVVKTTGSAGRDQNEGALNRNRRGKQFHARTRETRVT